jgi:hypothetical protein
MSPLLVFHRVYKLEVQLVMLVFSTSFVNYFAPLTFSLASSPPPPFPCVNKYTEYMYAVCKKGYGVIGGEEASDS